MVDPHLSHCHPLTGKLVCSKPSSPVWFVFVTVAFKNINQQHLGVWEWERVSARGKDSLKEGFGSKHCIIKLQPKRRRNLGSLFRRM